MKALKYLAIGLLPILSGCLNEDFSPETWGLEPKLDFSNSVLVFNRTFGSDTVSVFTNYSTFRAVSSEDWCKVSIDALRNFVIISPEPNFDVMQRSAVITISIERGAKSLSKDISVVQMGGVWDTIGSFNVFWGYEISDTQHEAISDLLNSMVFIPAGSFVMGQTDEPLVDTATPHDVNLSTYYISAYELSQSQWNAVMGSNPSLQKDPDLPVHNISWADALDFVTKLSQLTNLDVRLPSEAQWEYAAKGGCKSQNYVYSGSNDILEVAQVCENATIPFKRGLKKPNELGLYDMSGNVAEFCFDWYERNYIGDLKTDPTGPITGFFKCRRGGDVSDFETTHHLRCTNREWKNGHILDVNPLTGIRIVIVP